MEENEFLEKYGSEIVRVSSMYKTTAYFSNEKVSINGVPCYRGEIFPTMTVNDFYKEVEYFNFDIKDKSLHVKQ